MRVGIVALATAAASVVPATAAAQSGSAPRVLVVEADAPVEAADRLRTELSTALGGPVIGLGDERVTPRSTLVTVSIRAEAAAIRVRTATGVERSAVLDAESSDGHAWVVPHAASLVREAEGATPTTGLATWEPGGGIRMRRIAPHELLPWPGVEAVRAARTGPPPGDALETGETADGLGAPRPSR